MATTVEAGTPAVDTPVDSLFAPICKIMLEKSLIGGIDRKLYTGELVILIFTTVDPRNPWVLLAFPPTHLILWLTTKHGPDQFNCYLRYSEQDNFYELRPMFRQTRNIRLKDFVRGELC